MMCTAKHIFLVIYAYTLLSYLSRMPSTHSTNSGTFYRIKTGSLHIQCCVQLSTYSQSIYAYILLSYLSRMPSTHSTNSGKSYRRKTGSLHIQFCVQLNTYSQSIYAHTLLPYLSRMPSTHSTNSGKIYRITKPGVSSCPPSCKISPCNSTISIEPTFATFEEKALVESIKHILKCPKNALTWPQYDPNHVILHVLLLSRPYYSVKI